MKVFNQKKGAVELSLNLIIMLVIGLTVLGLIISFVTSFLGNAENSFTDQLNQDDEVQLNKVLNEAGNFVIAPTAINVDKGSDEAAKLFFKIRNPGSIVLEVTTDDGQLNVGNTPTNDLTVEFSVGRGGDVGSLTNLRAYIAPVSLESGESNSYPVGIYADGDVITGTYYAKFYLNVNGEDYNEIVTLTVE